MDEGIIAYEIGRKHFRSGKKECPYNRESASYKVMRWWNGYLDSRTEKALRLSREDWGDPNELARDLEAENNFRTLPRERQ